MSQRYPYARESAVKGLVDVLMDTGVHWVGDGFPVRTVFSYEERGQELSPFLLFDYAGPHTFAPANRRRGVGPHPHRGFETVTIVYEGEVAHRDSTGHAGVIGPGDVQWLTAGAGVVHQEFHSASFTQRGGVFQVVQLWVNLPAARKLAAPRYQAIKAAEIPVLGLRAGAGQVRVIAGAFDGTTGPARTFTEVNVWDLEFCDQTKTILEAPDGDTSLIVVLSGKLVFEGKAEVAEAQAALLSREGRGVEVTATPSTRALMLTGAPIEEPIFGRGPFVMNTVAQVRDAFVDFGTGKFGAIGAR